MKKFIILIITLTTFLACTKDVIIDDAEKSGMYYNGDVNLSILNEDSIDLLNINNEGAYTISEIELLYIVDGEKIKPLDFNQDANCNQNGLVTYNKINVPNYAVFRFAPTYVLSLEDSLDTKYWTCDYILHLNNNETDSIKLQWCRKFNYLAWNKIWYNGLELYPINNNIFPIIKNN
jgi:hypothetical protein